MKDRKAMGSSYKTNIAEQTQRLCLSSHCINTVFMCGWQCFFGIVTRSIYRQPVVSRKGAIKRN